MFTLVPVILAKSEEGGLWPLGSGSHKQFLPMGKNGETLFSAAYKRALMVAPSRNILVVTPNNAARQSWQEIRNINKKSKAQAILEPLDKNSAAAVAMAAVHALNYFENPVLWVMPSDQYVEKPFSLVNAVQEAAQKATSDKIVSFATLPSDNDGNYGHMVCGQELHDHHNLFTVKLFLEKPRGARLQWFNEQQNFMRSTGMFMFSAQQILKYMKSRNKLLVNAASHAYKNAVPTKFGLLAGIKSYSELPAFSLEKLVMEDNTKLVARPVNIGWRAIDSWKSLQEVTITKASFGQELERFLLRGRNAA